MWLFLYFNFERNYDVLKSKSPCILLNKNINFNKNETESKMKSLKDVVETLKDVQEWGVLRPKLDVCSQREKGGSIPKFRHFFADIKNE